MSRRAQQQHQASTSASSQREMATALSLSGAGAGGSLLRRRPASPSSAARCYAVPHRRAPTRRLDASRADDSSPAPFEMTVEGALRLLDVADGASFDEILRTKKAVVASCKDDLDVVAQLPPPSLPKLLHSMSSPFPARLLFK